MILKSIEINQNILEFKKSIGKVDKDEAKEQVNFSKNNKNSLGQIQKIYSTTKFICFSTRGLGSSAYIYFGRGGSSIGFWVLDKLPPPGIRVRDRFLEYLRKHLLDGHLQDIYFDNENNFFHLTLIQNEVINEIKTTYEHQLIIHFEKKKNYFYHLYYPLLSKMKIDFKNFKYNFFSSFESRFVQEEIRGDFENDQSMWNWGKDFLFQKISKKSLNRGLTANDFWPKRPSSEKNDDKVLNLIENEIKELLKNYCNISKKLKFLDKKISNIKEDIINGKKWESLSAFISDTDKFQRYCQKIEGNFPSTPYLLLDINEIQVKLYKHDSIYLKKDSVYKKIKKLKKSVIIQEKRLEEIEKEKKSVLKEQLNPDELYLKLINSKFLFEKEFLETKTIAMTFKNGDEILSNDINNLDQGSLSKTINNTKESNQEKSIEIYVFDSKIQVGVGKNSTGNDFLRNKWGNPGDLWFHLEGYKSAHLVVKNISYDLLFADLDFLQFIASIICDYSNLQIYSAPLVMTLLKNVKGVKGSSGKVLLKNQKYLQVDYKKDWQNFYSKRFYKS